MEVVNNLFLLNVKLQQDSERGVEWGREAERERERLKDERDTATNGSLRLNKIIYVQNVPH